MSKEKVILLVIAICKDQKLPIKLVTLPYKQPLIRSLRSLFTSYLLSCTKSFINLNLSYHIICKGVSLFKLPNFLKIRGKFLEATLKLMVFVGSK